MSDQNLSLHVTAVTAAVLLLLASSAVAGETPPAGPASLRGMAGEKVGGYDRVVWRYDEIIV